VPISELANHCCPVKLLRKNKGATFWYTPI
jgi:hypothetical protein